MVLTIQFQEQPTNEWYTGYHFDCKKNFKKTQKGPKNGTPIKITNLPISSKNSYLRFWAARKNLDKNIWDNLDDAYRHVEHEPGLNYYNGGFVEIDKKGVALIRLELPSGYINNQGEKEKPHLHFRICSKNNMSHVYTLPIPKTNINSSIKLLN